ncbi:hypothetical protein HK097_008519 [Rhizophlyctis rosea]|uniref:Uncharacterized protein n=1 Tax=Rhizophlyctis rosea TaxID=64517 RepID=A0AAD5SBS9_9FUNG|nr:hypothetical protein HK097_008519 [Rhizophlyctis rosea]
MAAPAPPAASGSGTTLLTTPVFRDMIHTETIKKELRLHTLYDNYNLTPTVAHRIVVTNKPNEKLEDGKGEVEDDEYINILTTSRLPPSQHYSTPQTTSQQYGWDTKPLIDHRRLDKRFYHPKVETEITKMYGAAMIMKGDSKKGAGGKGKEEGK